MDKSPESSPSSNDSTSSAHSQAAAPAAPRSGMQPLTVALIVIIVLLLFAMLMLTLGGGIFQSDKASQSGLANVETRNAQLRADINAERARQGLPPLPEDASTAQAAADRLQHDATTLAALASQWQTILSEKDTRIRDLESQAAAHGATTQRLYQQITELQNSLSRAGNSESQLAAVRAELERARKQIRTQQDQLAALQNRPTSDAMSRLEKQLSSAVASNGAMQKELAQLRAQLKDTMPKAEYDELAADLAKFKEENNKLRYLVQTLRAQLDRARLFIKAKDLPAEAARLFARLKTLENATPAELTVAYKNIHETLGAKIIHRQSFATGSSQITFERESLIRDLVTKSTNPNAFYLVVGYASLSGGADANEELSAKRATTTASVVNILKAPGQEVRAVYLGETKRFSSTKQLSNQICEIWEIKR